MGMKRGKDYIVFALDVPTVAEAKDFSRMLAGRVAMFKIGLELFVEAGPEIVKIVKDLSGAGVFLDLKFHDIPATVARAMKVVAGLGVDLATVHCGESERMLEAAVEASEGRAGVLGVTVLTSVSDEDIAAAGFKDRYSSNLKELVLKRAAMAKRAGCAGVVCSGLEAKEMKDRFGKDFLAVTPGIRPAWELSPADDQKRVATPASAVRDGADFLVIGRPIHDAANPAEAATKIAEEIEKR
jgi:orotidine-5'-phosphate decarboxylase